MPARHKPSTDRLTVALERDEVVVFMIGMRLNRPWKLWSWLPVAWAMGRMVRELQSRPDSPMLHQLAFTPGLSVQYWRSAQELIAYAADRDSAHYPAWAAFNRLLRDNGDVGIWHETYVVPRANIEAVYHHMPPHGLGAFAPLIPATGRHKRAASRLGLPSA